MSPMYGGRPGRTVGSEARIEHTFQAMLDAAPDALVGVDRSGTIVMANIQTENVFGHKREDLVGQPIEVLVPDRVKDVHPQNVENYFNEPRDRPMWVRLDLAGQRADGTEFPAEISLSSVDTDDGVLALAAIRDVTDRKRAEQETREARAEADRANQAKSDFLSRMSHELRTPLNSILGFAQLLRMDETSDTRSRALDQIINGGEHLLELINEILDISRIESGRMKLSIEPVLLADVLDEAQHLVSPLADQTGIRLFPALIGRDIYVHADRQRLKQVLLNLLSNAVKYNRDDGEVRIAYERQSDARMRVSIIDTGVGIAGEDMEELFAPFSRFSADHYATEGSGLGLALSKGLVETMGGAMGATSTLGEGSTFWIDLPVARDQELPDPPTPDQGLAVVEPGEAKTILYIEDNPANLELIESILAHRPDVTLTTATEGGTGLELARRGGPDLILLDLHLPDMTGQEVLEKLRADDATRSIPVAVVSADSSSETLNGLAEFEAVTFLTKPLNVRRFLEAIDSSLAQTTG